MASSIVSDMSPPSKRARKFDSKAPVTHYHQYIVSVDKLHLEMLYTADTVERGREILTLSPERQPFTKCKEVLRARLGVVRMIRDGGMNFEIARGIAPEEYIMFMESVGVDYVSTMAALREIVLNFLECSSVEQLDLVSRRMASRLSNARKIFQAAMQTAELIQHMAMNENITIPPHLAVLQPRPHAARPPPEAVEATSEADRA